MAAHSVGRDRRAEYSAERSAAVSALQRRSAAPLPTRPAPEGLLDLTGLAVGRLRVVGLLHTREKGHAPRWVVRCLCGYYEVRAAGVLLDPDYSLRAACTVCDYEREMLAGRASPRTRSGPGVMTIVLSESATPVAPALASPDKRVLRAILAMPADSTLAQIAAAAAVTTKEARAALGRLVKAGRLRLRPDGWYERPLRASSRRSDIRHVPTDGSGGG